MAIIKYSNFNNIKLDTLPKNLLLTEQMLIERCGSLENLNLVKSYGLASTDKEIYEFSGFLNSINAPRTLIIEVAAGIIAPLAEKLNVSKGSIFWYILTYGIVESLYQLGKQLLDKDKSLDFCKAFSTGVGMATKYWMSDKILIKVLGFFGIDISKGGFIQNSISHNIQDQLLTEEKVSEWVNGLICAANFDYDGKKMSLFEIIYTYFTDSVSSIWNSFFNNK